MFIHLREGASGVGELRRIAARRRREERLERAEQLDGDGVGAAGSGGAGALEGWVAEREGREHRGCEANDHEKNHLPFGNWPELNARTWYCRYA